MPAFTLAAYIIIRVSRVLKFSFTVDMMQSESTALLKL